jgi:type IV secretion system protein VirB9
MKSPLFALTLASAAFGAYAQPGMQVVSKPDPRIRTVVFSPDEVITIGVARGVATQIVLPDDEAIVGDPAMGKGADCRQPEHHWCVDHGTQDVFVKPRLGADWNTMDLTTNRHRYVFVFKALPPGQAFEAALRVSIVTPALPVVAAPVVDAGPPPLSPQELIANRMKAEPIVRNKNYSVAVGKDSEDIVPVLVFDDGTQTYFSFPNNRPLPTIFQTSPDKTEEMVNVRMQGDMLVADRVARRFVLRLGGSVIAIINEAFDIDGVPPVDGTTVRGVARVLRTAGAGEVTQ